MDYQLDAYPVDDDRGGIRSREKIKILVCVLLRDLGASVDRAVMQSALYESGVANYFEVSQAIDGLARKSALDVTEVGDRTFIALTDTGLRVAEVLEGDVSRYIRAKAADALRKALG